MKAEIARELGVAHTFIHRRVSQAKKAGLTDGKYNKSARRALRLSSRLGT